MKQWKLLLDFKGKSIVKQSLENAMENCGQIVISGGFRIDDLKSHIGQIENVQIIENPEYRKGMLSSIKAALPYIQTDRFFITLGDMPFIPPEVYGLMSGEEFDDVLFPVFHGKRGHPVLINSSLIEGIKKADDRLKMKEILKPFRISEIQIQSEGILLDIDTVRDYEKMTKEEFS
ncbi:MAG: NTP transferase domain-containing protein [Spirochaetaceae bacterium]|nr:NTP transferase domain-containing protein [Spirochaetaceae bacterium]